jgi:selenocysteine lyase/cysteine desulfurase
MIGVLLRKHGMLMLDAFEGHLTLDVRSVIHAMNADFLVVSGRVV